MWYIQCMSARLDQDVIYTFITTRVDVVYTDIEMPVYTDIGTAWCSCIISMTLRDVVYSCVGHGQMWYIHVCRHGQMWYIYVDVRCIYSNVG
jgi:hypothetical protein